MFFRRKKKEAFWLPEFEALAQYNAEVARGIAHRPDWQRRMAALQARYNERQREYAEQEVITLIET